jgi:hypothetical protein
MTRRVFEVANLKRWAASRQRAGDDHFLPIPVPSQFEHPLLFERPFLTKSNDGSVSP